MSRASAGAQWPSTRTVCRLLAKSSSKSAPNRVQVSVRILVFEVSGAGPTPEGWRAPEGDARQLDSRIDCCNACPGKALEQDPWCVPGQSLPNPAPSDRPHFSFQGRRASVRIRLENHGAFRPLGRRREPTDGRMDLASVSWTQIVTWEEAPLKGESPEARSGHTLTVVDTKAYLLGGTGRKDGKCPI